MGKRKNGFVIYFEEYMSKQRRLGRNISKKTAVEECGPKWERLSSDEKKFYNDLANDQKCEKLKIKQETFVNLESSNRFGDEVKYLIAAIDSEEALKNYKFYVVHINYYCKTAEGLYVPAELAIAEFNLKNGVLRTCHTLIDPGEVPLGYAYDAKRNSDEVHCIPMPPYEEGNKNFDDILEKVIQFMEPSKQGNESYAPLFAAERNMDATTNVLEYLTIFRYVLSNAWAEVERDVFRYSTGISCEFHKKVPEKYHGCSLSVAQRLIYMICDHCCQYLNIDLVLGKHVPLNFSKSEFELGNQASSNASRNCEAQSSFDDFVASGCSATDTFEEVPTERNELRLMSRYDDDSFSSDDDLFVTIGRGKRMGSRQRTKERFSLN